MKLIRASTVLVAACGFAGSSTAHHSPAAFDQSKEIVIEGKLTRFSFNNPHTYLTLEIVGPDGAAMSQDVEAGPISTVQPLGLMRDSLQVGEHVAIRGNPSRRGAGHTCSGSTSRARTAKSCRCPSLPRARRAPKHLPRIEHRGYLASDLRELRWTLRCHRLMAFDGRRTATLARGTA